MWGAWAAALSCLPWGGGKREPRRLLAQLLGDMAGPAGFPLAALLLSHCLDSGTGKGGLTIWAAEPVALGSPLQLLCAVPAGERVSLVSWWREGRNRSREDLALIHPTHGAHLPPARRGPLRVSSVADGRAGLTLPSLGPPDNGTRVCCKFSTFPAGVSEQCLALLLPEPAPDSPGAPRAALRAEVLGSLGAGAFFLLGSAVVLGHLLRARRRRTLLVSGPHPCLPSSQETPMALWVQQGLPGRRNSFSAPYVLINLDYFTPPPSASAHGGLQPPPLPPPRPGRARGQDPGLSRATHGGQGREEQGPAAGTRRDAGCPPLRTRSRTTLERQRPPPRPRQEPPAPPAPRGTPPGAAPRSRPLPEPL